MISKLEAEVERLKREHAFARDGWDRLMRVRTRSLDDVSRELAEARADAETLRQENERLRGQLAAAIEQDYCTMCGNALADAEAALAAAQEPPAEGGDL